MHSAEFGMCNSVFATASFRGRDLESKDNAMLCYAIRDSECSHYP